jgi:hypothetical protein
MREGPVATAPGTDLITAALAFSLAICGPVKNETRAVGVIMSVYCANLIAPPMGSPELNVVPVSQDASFPVKTASVKRQGRTVTAKVKIPKFRKPQADHNRSHFFDRNTGRKVELPLVVPGPMLVGKVIERSVKPGRDFVKDSFHLFVTWCVHTCLTPERSVLGSEGILDLPPVTQTGQLSTLHLISSQSL